MEECPVYAGPNAVSYLLKPFFLNVNFMKMHQPNLPSS